GFLTEVVVDAKGEGEDHIHQFRLHGLIRSRPFETRLAIESHTAGLARKPGFDWGIPRNRGLLELASSLARLCGSPIVESLSSVLTHETIDSPGGMTRIEQDQLARRHDCPLVRPRGKGPHLIGVAIKDGESRGSAPCSQQAI